MSAERDDSRSTSPDQAQNVRKFKLLEGRQEATEGELARVESTLAGVMTWAEKIAGSQKESAESLKQLAAAIGRPATEDEQATGLFAEMLQVRETQQKMLDVIGEPTDESTGIKGRGMRRQLAILWKDFQQRKISVAVGTGVGTGLMVTIVEIARLILN